LIHNLDYKHDFTINIRKGGCTTGGRRRSPDAADLTYNGTDIGRNMMYRLLVASTGCPSLPGYTEDVYNSYSMMLLGDIDLKRILSLHNSPLNTVRRISTSALLIPVTFITNISIPPYFTLTASRNAIMYQASVAANFLGPQLQQRTQFCLLKRAQKVLILCLNADSRQGVFPCNKLIRNTCES
ncbi:hypothetical protein AFLA_000052, partial [Aspergillus flavus NRRL3357]